MYYLLVFVFGAIAGAICAVIIYRRNTAKIEAALVEAVALRDKARAEAEALKKKLGG
jgi:hypothetical protein